ncbi:hypothetical protein MSG28_009756 [Choristoneura fumiferana]|uniref:Uncharacterized protein n=1 Tax=Choristoneura fumiferana TaxID=7141 RepID=A0ACC0JCP9_CHOFU|nr:hypothetical protein MSG28_009756 [Choristoneura fumiferana]
MAQHYASAQDYQATPRTIACGGGMKEGRRGAGAHAHAAASAASCRVLVRAERTLLSLSARNYQLSALQHVHGVREQRAHGAAAHHAGKNSFTDLGLHDMKISTGNDSFHLPTTANLKEAFAVEKPRQTASSSSDKRKITKNKKYRSPPSLPMKPIEEELNEIHADTVTSESSMECGRPDTK